MDKRLEIVTRIVLLLGCAIPLFALTSAEVPRVTTPPVIDGKLDDAVWATALKMTDFKTFKPDYGKEPSQRTEGYLLHDADNIYFAFRAYDTDPKKIKASISKRDSMGQDDFVGIFLDTFNTKQEAYMFMINPLGIQGDGIMNQSGNSDDKFDMVWYSKGQIDDQGYTVEGRIPLQSIRFPSKKIVTMMAAFYRQIVRTSEMVSFPAFYPDKGSLIAQTQPVVFNDLKYKRVIEFLPALTHSQRYIGDQGSLKRDLNETDFSLTAKVGLTSDLTLEGTVNPDFSQVESDAGQVDFNRRYALYYREKRPFFQEGNEIFTFAGTTEEAYFGAVVHTRMITDPSYGFKLNGKLGSSNSIAAIVSRDDVSNGDGGPNPFFSILRFKHALKDDGFLGGFYTAKDQGDGYNRVIGADGRLRLSPTATAEFHVFGSFSRPLEGGDRVDGYDGAATYSFGNRHINIQLAYEEISPNFQVDTGFLMRTGVRTLTHFVNYIFYPKSKFLLTIEPFYYGVQLYDTTYNMFETINVLALRFGLPRSSQFRVDAILGNEQFMGQMFDRNAWRIQGWTQITKQVYFQAMFRRGGSIFYDPDDPYQGYGNQAMATLQYQPMEKLDLMVDLTYVDFFRRSDHSRVYDYAIIRSWNTFQINQYLFLRAIVEYNSFRKRLTLDTLVSFTYIPGTVVFFGYGSAQEKLRWDGLDYVESDRYREMQRGFFFKVSYLWRI
jgi:hypothetical protein